MRHIPIFFLTFIASAALAGDFRWLEGEWISDTDATMAGHPELENVDAATYSTFRDMYGRLRWRFDNGTLQVIYPEYQASPPSSYSVREWESGELELLMEGSEWAIAYRERTLGSV